MTVDVSKLDRALQAALIFLGINPEEARFRLKDILVEEVSLVDRAANRRKFLIVKRAGAAAKQESTTIQTLIFSKEQFKTAASAVAWAKDHDFKATDVEETESSFRLRQLDPGRFKDGTFRTIELTDGVKAVIGVLKMTAKAVWSTAFINDLPDSSFLFIEPGGEKDEDGKTVPRSLRHFPVMDQDGNIDLPHLRNAIARIPQAKIPGFSAEDKQRLQERARQMLEEAQQMTTAAKQELTLPTPVKEDLMRVVTEATERLVAVGEVVRAAQETAEVTEPPVPEELLMELGEINGLLHDAISRYSAPMAGETQEAGVAAQATTEHKAASPVSSALLDVSTGAGELAQQLADGAAMDADKAAALRGLAAELNGLAEAHAQPDATKAGDGDSATADTEAKAEGGAAGEAADEPSGEEPPMPTDKELDEGLSVLGTEAADKLSVIAQAMRAIAEVDNAVDLLELRNRLVGVGKALRALSAEEQADVAKAIGNAKLLRILAALLGQEEPAPDAAATSDAEPAPAAAPAEAPEAADKRAAEVTPQPPAREPGDLGNVASAGPPDEPAKNVGSDDPLAAIMKRLDAIEKTAAGTPQVPASRTEQSTPQSAAPSETGPRSGRRGGPWIM